MQRKPLAVLLAGLIAAPALAAQDYQLEDVVVTATRLPQPQTEVISDVSVLTRADIERAGQATLAEVLRGLPGVEITQSGGAGSVASIFIRGANAGHTLVLVDGVPMNSATLGSARLEHIPLQLVERIEVVRGPMSHLYGSSAIGGVIQVFTRQPGGPRRLSASAELGSYGHAGAEAAASGTAADWRYALAAGHQETEGFSARPAGYADNDGYRNTHASLRLERDLMPGHTLQAHGMASDGRTQFDDGVTPYDSRTHARIGNLGVGLRSRFGEDWQSELRLDFAKEDVDTRGYSDPFLPFFAGGPYASRIGMDQWQYAWQLDGHTRLGEVQALVERLEQEVDGDVGYTVARRSRNALLLGWRQDWGRHGLSLNLRGDRDSQFGSHTTWTAGYGLALTPAWRAVASVGTAYKAPSFDDLYWPGAGNPDLRPETARNAEVGIRYETRARQASATLYHNRVDDLIQWADTGVDIDGDGWSDWLPSNVARARLQGLTLAWRERVGPYTWRASIDLQEPENVDTGKLLILRSRSHGSLGLDYSQGAWKLFGEVVAQGKRYNDADNTRKLPGYALLNLGLSRTLARDWTLDARLDNVLDKDYRLSDRYASAGRSAFVAVRYQTR